MPSSYFALIWLVLFAAPSVFATKGNLPSVLKAYPREIRVTRHHATDLSPASDLVTQTLWKYDGGFFEVTGTQHLHTFGGMDCESLLGEQSGFGINKMSTTEYLDPAQEDFYQGLSRGLKRRQITFYETFRLIPEGEPQLADLPVRNRNLESMATQPGIANVRSAGLWSFSGQSWDVREKRFRIEKLPWQHEDEWAPESAAFDRAKYPYVWEWGRAAQDLPGDILPLYFANAYGDLHELNAYRARLDQAYVMFHSLDETNTRLYEHAFPNSRYASRGEGNVLFLVPLSQVLKRYPPAKISKNVADLQRLEPRLSDLDTLAILEDFRASTWQEADIKNTDGRTFFQPLAIVNWSATTKFHRLKFFLSRFGIPESRFEEFRAYLTNNVLNDYKNFDTGQYGDITDELLSAKFLLQTDTLELSNVPALIAGSKDHVQSLLVEAVFHHLRELAGPFATDGNYIQAIADRLTDYGHNIAVSTWDPYLSAQLSALGGKIQSQQIPRDQVDPKIRERLHSLYGLPDREFHQYNVITFPMSRIRDLSVDLKRLPNLKVYLEAHALEYRLRQPIQF